MQLETYKMAGKYCIIVRQVSMDLIGLWTKYEIYGSYYYLSHELHNLYWKKVKQKMVLRDLLSNFMFHEPRSLYVPDKDWK